MFMARYDKVLSRVLCGTCDAAIGFEEICELLRRLGFQERIRGSHHIFAISDIEEILNLQPRQHQAKPYQVRQVRQIILKYRLGGGFDGE